MFSRFTWIFGEQTNSVSAGTDIQLKTALMRRCTDRPRGPFQTAVRECRDVQVSGQPGTAVHQGNLKLTLALTWNQFFHPHSIKSGLFLNGKGALHSSFAFSIFLRYRWLYLIVSLLQSNLLKRSKLNTRSQIHRWYNSIDFGSITPGIDPAVTVSIKVSGKEVYLLS